MKKHILITLLLMFLSGSSLAFAGDEEPYNVSFDYNTPTMSWNLNTTDVTVEAGLVGESAIQWVPTLRLFGGIYFVPEPVSCKTGVYIRANGVVWGPYDCLTRLYLPLIAQ